MMPTRSHGVCWLIPLALVICLARPVSAVNRAPIAEDDGTYHANPAVTIAVLNNDWDPDGDPLRITAVSAPAYGSVEILGRDGAGNGGSLRYTPHVGFVGTDSFTYTISDGLGQDTATVTVSNRAPVAENEGPYHANPAVTIAVLNNDGDPDGNPLRITDVSPPAYGVVEILGRDNAGNGGSLRYTPRVGFVGTDSFTYTISDGLVEDTATVTVFNRAPIAVDEGPYHANPAVTIAVLNNDGDPDGNPLRITAVSTPAFGAVEILGRDGNGNGGSLRYTPRLGFVGTDSFSYTISDGLVEDTATVTVFNRAPIAVDEGPYHANPAVTIAVLNNDGDPDGNPLRITDVSTPTYGSVEILGRDGNGNGGYLRYTPRVGFVGTDSFSYTISDGLVEDTATVTVFNTGPIAQDEGPYHANPAVTIAVLNNDWDPDGNPLRITAVSTPARGTVEILGRDNAGNGGALRYTPAVGFVGTESFTYTISDGLVEDTATVTVFNTGPIAQDEGPYPAAPTVDIAILNNDWDADGDPLRIAAVGVPAHGTVAILGRDGNGNGGYLRYTATTPHYAGTDFITYTISDGLVEATATVALTVDVPNQAPVAADDGPVLMNQAVDIAVLTNDADPEGDPVRITAVGAPAQGAVEILGRDAHGNGGYLRYTPALGFVGTDSFTYTISDGLAESSATVTVGALVSAVSLTSTPARQIAGRPILLTAQATGGIHVEYLFRIGFKSGEGYLWSTLRGYAPAPTCSWTPTEARIWSVVVWAREVGHTTNYDAFKSVAVQAWPTLSAVSLLPAPRSPKAVHTPITLTAAPVGGSDVRVMFRVGFKSGSTMQWTTLREYGAERTIVWTPTEARLWSLAVYAKEADSSKFYDVYKTVGYLSYPTPPTAVALTATPAPGRVDAEVLLRATPTGGTDVRYWFRVGRKVGTAYTWQTLQGYSDVDECRWTPTTAGTYILAVYAKEYGDLIGYNCYKTISYTVMP
jgi:hypothetical protein